jgi:opacity protein-like surface antigen
MRKVWILLWFVCAATLIRAQRVDLDVFLGISNYQGDLQPAIFTLNNASAGQAFILKYGISDNIYARAGFSFGTIRGDDKNNTDEELRQRNLNFQSSLQEFHAGLEYRFLRTDNIPITPYIFAGFGFFHYDPYTYDTLKTTGAWDKVFLQPLSTEGQGLPQFPDRKPYNLTQMCIPYGLGIKWQVNCNLNVGVEFRHTKVFSDYLDDVSNTYADPNELLTYRGEQAVRVAWRRDEYDGVPYPTGGNINRGNPKQDDWYYFAGFTLGLRFNDCQTGRFSMGGLFNKNKGVRAGKTDCPKNVW